MFKKISIGLIASAVCSGAAVAQEFDEAGFELIMSELGYLQTLNREVLKAAFAPEFLHSEQGKVKIARQCRPTHRTLDDDLCYAVGVPTFGDGTTSVEISFTTDSRPPTTETVTIDSAGKQTSCKCGMKSFSVHAGGGDASYFWNICPDQVQ